MKKQWRQIFKYDTTYEHKRNSYQSQSRIYQEYIFFYDSLADFFKYQKLE